MTEAEVIAIVHRHVESHFPKTCRSCGRRFESLLDYLRGTKHVGEPVSYDLEAGDSMPSAPIGTYAFANCTCGSTLAIGSDGLPLWTLWKLLRWGRAETKRRGVSMQTLLAQIRDEIDRQVLSEAAARDSQPR